MFQVYSSKKDFCKSKMITSITLRYSKERITFIVLRCRTVGLTHINRNYKVDTKHLGTLFAMAKLLTNWFEIHLDDTAEIIFTSSLLYPREYLLRVG